MLDNFNENGFQNDNENNDANTNENNSSFEEKNDVFDFMTGASFYNDTPSEKQSEDETQNIYNNDGQTSYNPYTAPNSANYQSNFQTQNNYSSPNQNGFGQSEPVRPYDFSRNAYKGEAQYNNSQYNASATASGDNSSKKGKKVVFAIIVVAVIIGIFAAVKALLPNDSDVDISTTLAGESSGETTNASGDQLVIVPTENTNVSQLNAVQVAEQAKPSVVGVMTYSNGQLSGEGSGVAMSVDSTGKYTYIITCAHVISDKGVTYGVLTLEGKNYEATLVAYDARTDIGVLKVEATDIPLAQFGDSTSLKVGETVYAIGNPGGSEFFGSFTDGIISAIDRSVSGTYTMTCIQHNAAINPGNSGGALVNSAGQVIGINSSKIAATDYEGMGFAVPMSIVKPVVDSLIQYGYVPNRPKLGIEYASVSSYQLYSMVVAIKGLPSGSLVIAGISSDSTLANTDAAVGDLIIAVNGEPMDTSDVLLDLINTGAVGDSITLTLCRVENRTYKTSTFDVTITLVEDKGDSEEEETTTSYNEGGYYYGGQSSFEEFFNEYFGF